MIRQRKPIGRKVIRIIEEARLACVYFLKTTDLRSKVLTKRLLLKMVDEMRHSDDRITCRLIKSQQTMVPMNGRAMNCIQYFELSISEAMQILTERLGMKVRPDRNPSNSV